MDSFDPDKSGIKGNGKQGYEKKKEIGRGEAGVQRETRRDKVNEVTTPSLTKLFLVNTNPGQSTAQPSNRRVSSNTQSPGKR